MSENEIELPDQLTHAEMLAFANANLYFIQGDRAEPNFDYCEPEIPSYEWDGEHWCRTDFRPFLGYDLFTRQVVQVVGEKTIQNMVLWRLRGGSLAAKSDITRHIPQSALEEYAEREAVAFADWKATQEDALR